MHVAREKGLVNLGYKLNLENVLCVLGLKCNLLSIFKLCKQSNYAVEYFDDLCAINYHTSRTLIEAGEQLEGVYYFKED